jgi:predicted DNA-binding transcriptional regulator AlpA
MPTPPRPREIRARRFVSPEQPILRSADVCTLTTLSRAALLRLISLGEFPAPFRLGKRAIAWHRRDVEAWLADRPKVKPAQKTGAGA